MVISVFSNPALDTLFSEHAVLRHVYHRGVCQFAYHDGENFSARADYTVFWFVRLVRDCDCFSCTTTRWFFHRYIRESESRFCFPDWIARGRFCDDVLCEGGAVHQALAGCRKSPCWHNPALEIARTRVRSRSSFTACKLRSFSSFRLALHLTGTFSAAC